MNAQELVQKIRASTGLSQSKFAAQSGIPKSSLQGWEQGARIVNGNSLIQMLDSVNPEILRKVDKMLK